MANFNITYLDTLPTLSVTLTDSAGTALTLAAASNVKLHMLRYASGTGETVSGQTVVTKTMTIASPATSGVVTYTFQIADYGSTAGTVQAGYYYIEFEINYASGARLTVPTPETRYSMFVRDDLD